MAPLVLRNNVKEILHNRNCQLCAAASSYHCLPFSLKSPKAQILRPLQNFKDTGYLTVAPYIFLPIFSNSSFLPPLSSFISFSSTIFHIILIMWVWRMEFVKISLFIDIFLYSHHLSAWFSIDTVRKNSVSVIHGSNRVDKWFFLRKHFKTSTKRVLAFDHQYWES